MVRRPGRTTSQPPPVVGIVEEFSRRLVRGWLVVDPQAPPTRVDLYLDDLLLSSTYATADAAMSGVDSVLRRGRPTEGRVAAPLDHAWQAQPVPGPADDRRNSGRQVRTFSFRVRGIWPYVNRRTRVTVKVGRHHLPIHGHGMFLSPPQRGKRSMTELRELVAGGHVLSQFGRIQLSKKLDLAWQSAVMSLYGRLRTVFAEEFGHDLFLIYGTLLGAVREGGVIGHDVDLDTAFVSSSRTGRGAARELTRVALRLVELGYDVEAFPALLHVVHPATSDERIDIFHTWFDDSGILRFPFGIAGSTVVEETGWAGTREIDFAGGRALVPVHDESVVECLYGADWQRPKPGFNWRMERTDAAPEGELDEAERSRIYWADFYAHHGFARGSSFSAFVDALPDLPDTVVDLGCGDGRDALALGARGRRVLGLDRSATAIQHATARAVEERLDRTVQFAECDVADRVALAAALERAAAGPTLYYLRFFLHAIDEATQQGVLDVIDAGARPGDALAAEFRTDRDAATAKVHTRHYRRFQSAETFLADLRARGWQVTHHEEGTGLSPYGDEDPVLCRVIARRPVDGPPGAEPGSGPLG